jgi:hypothetical protein
MFRGGLRAPSFFMKVAYIVPARDKEKWVRRSVLSVLEQTYSPLEILLSDQGSIDGTRAILADMVRSYEGPHTVRLLDCPHTEPKGMHGCNVHINWICEQTDADIILLTTADDLAHVDRTSHVVAAFIKHQASMVLTAHLFSDPELNHLGESALPRESKFITVQECFTDRVAGSASIAWSHEWFNRIGGLPPIAGSDVYLPFLAILDRGCYFLKDKLHVYVKYADPENTGLEGIWEQANDTEKLQLEELMHFQVTNGLFCIVGAMQRLGLENEAAHMALCEQIFQRAASWQNVRAHMTLAKIPPISLKA